MPDQAIPDDRAIVVREVKQMLIESLDLEDIEPSDLADDEPLFESGLDLDSIDALELVVGLEKKYGIKIGNSEESKRALRSIDTLADLVMSKRGGAAE